MHFQDQHLEPSDLPNNEVAYNYFNSIEVLWFLGFFYLILSSKQSVISAELSPLNNIFVLSHIVPPQFDTSAQSSKNIFRSNA